MILANHIKQMTFKKIAYIFSVSLVIAGVLMPTASIAADRTTRTALTTSTPTGTGFCALYTKVVSVIDQRLADRQAKFDQQFEKRATQLQTRWEGQDTRLESFRKQADTNRDKHYAKLEENAKTDEQKQAVTKFMTAVEAAVAARRDSVDKAVADFRAAITVAAAVRQTALQAAKKTFADSVKIAFSQAKTDCANKVSSETVRQNLRASLTAAKEKLQQDLQAVQKLRVDAEPLIAARQAAIEKAVADFKTATQQATADLKAVFPTSAEIPEPGK